MPNTGGWCAAAGGRCYKTAEVEANFRMGFAVACVVGEGTREYTHRDCRIFCGLESPLAPVRTRPTAPIWFRGLFHDARRGDTLRKCVLCPDCPPHKWSSWRKSQDAYESHWASKGPHNMSLEDTQRHAPY